MQIVDKINVKDLGRNCLLKKNIKHVKIFIQNKFNTIMTLNKKKHKNEDHKANNKYLC